MLKTIAGLQNVTVLSRDAQKKVQGAGGSCTMTYQDANGKWQIEQGSCAVATQLTGPGGTTYNVPYCKTASFSGPVTLSSNGGISRCGEPYASSIFFK
jgi:hypothetical protein